MPHLGAIRKGWQNENLARFLLSKISFVAHPSSIGDDLGSDFFCTLFRTEELNKREFLIPKNTFAIQIKSNPKRVDFSNNLEYLYDLEIPFFVGICNNSQSSLMIYSGEYLPILFSYKGHVKKLVVKCCNEPYIKFEDSYEEIGNDEFNLKFSFAVELKAIMSKDDLSSSVLSMEKICSKTHEYISSKKNGEYIFDIPALDPRVVWIFAGPGSNKVFRENFFKRLSEVFSNLKWIYVHKPHEFNKEEYALFKNFYQKLEMQHKYIPNHLQKVFSETVALVEQ